MQEPARLRRFSGFALRLLLIILVCVMLLGSSTMPPGDRTELVRAFTRNIEFDFVGWTLNSLRLKLFEATLGTSGYMSADARRRFVMDYLDLVTQIQQVEHDMNLIYADPNISNPQLATAPLGKKGGDLKIKRNRIGPIAEAILQSQVSYAVDQLGISMGGQPVPPILYHSTPLPLALIVSPRDTIRMDELISLVPDLEVDERTELEERIDRSLNVSSLVENIGGIGMYPSMVQQTNNLDWLSEVVAHEWTHNFLTLRPLGINYLTSPELRTMNETTASIAGKEIGRTVLEIFYPELIPPQPSPNQSSGTTPPSEPPAFDFRKEMHKTRVTVDQMLDEGKIEEAEEYMEMRRIIFWEHGFRSLRKINQAYFAFYGAYADEPGGAAGAKEDPIGTAVRSLREKSDSLAEFLNRISWMTSFEQLQEALEG